MNKIIVCAVFVSLILACIKAPELGNGYKFEVVDNVILCDSLNTILVGESILKYWVDSNYIAVQQNDIRTRKTNNANSINYWIINKNNSSKYGPLSQSKFITKCEEIGLRENRIWLDIDD
ncbi:MAG: DUF3997 domain-containing protein [Bacteroidia bacterium]|nr:DUF3997 domain-containing protein [Bacteroidia bacterium]